MGVPLLNTFAMAHYDALLLSATLYCYDACGFVLTISGTTVSRLVAIMIMTGFVLHSKPSEELAPNSPHCPCSFFTGAVVDYPADRVLFLLLGRARWPGVCGSGWEVHLLACNITSRGDDLIRAPYNLQLGSYRSLRDALAIPTPILLDLKHDNPASRTLGTRSLSPEVATRDEVSLTSSSSDSCLVAESGRADRKPETEIQSAQGLFCDV